MITYRGYLIDYKPRRKGYIAYLGDMMTEVGRVDVLFSSPEDAMRWIDEQLSGPVSRREEYGPCPSCGIVWMNYGTVPIEECICDECAMDERINWGASI